MRPDMWTSGQIFQSGHVPTPPQITCFIQPIPPKPSSLPLKPDFDLEARYPMSVPGSRIRPETKGKIPTVLSITLEVRRGHSATLGFEQRTSRRAFCRPSTRLGPASILRRDPPEVRTGLCVGPRERRASHSVSRAADTLANSPTSPLSAPHKRLTGVYSPKRKDEYEASLIMLAASPGNHSPPHLAKTPSVRTICPKEEGSATCGPRGDQTWRAQSNVDAYRILPAALSVPYYVLCQGWILPCTWVSLDT
eukprot:3641799-Rhodomonas_salina.3